MHRIFIVEDDPTIARIVAEELERWGYAVCRAEDFSRVMEEYRAFAPHLVLLDLSLPYRSGFHWCGEIRRESSVPIVFLSSAADNMNLVTALHQGADDFIPKPFDLSVLVAKIQATLRRTYDFAGGISDRLEHRGAILQPEDMSLRLGDQRVELTRNEFRMLQQLLEHKGSIVSREALIRRLWDDESFIDDNTLTVNINRLRKKLDDAGLPGFVATKKNAGYLIPQED